MSTPTLNCPRKNSKLHSSQAVLAPQYRRLNRGDVCPEVCFRLKAKHTTGNDSIKLVGYFYLYGT